jgi:hypothetical protein
VTDLPDDLLHEAAQAVYDDIDGGWSLPECMETSDAVLAAFVAHFQAQGATHIDLSTLTGVKAEGQDWGLLTETEAHEDGIEWMRPVFMPADIGAELAALGVRQPVVPLCALTPSEPT